MKKEIKQIMIPVFIGVVFLGNVCKVIGQKAERPNIIFIVTDDQHRNQFNFISEGQDAEGKPTNLCPNIDKLASEGVIFENSYVSSSVCTPSRYSIVTGTYASRGIGASNIKKYEGQTNITWNVHVDKKTNNIAQALKDHGYFTGGVGKNHTFKGDNPHEVSLDADPTDPVIKKQMEDNQASQVAAYKNVGFDYAGALYKGNLPNQYPVAVEDHNMEWIVDSALKFLDLAAGKKDPFFLYFATTLAHGPDKLGTKYKGNPLATPVGFLDKPLEVMASRNSVTERITEAGLEQEKADILWLDDGIGALLDKLEEINELENTVIFFIDDHGVESGKGSLYEGGIKTVSFVYGPNYIKSGLRSKQLVSNIDMVPTALELAGADPVNTYKLDGVSMLPLLNGSTEEIHESLYFEMGATRAILKDGYKYLAFKAPNKVKSKLEKNGKKATHICDKPGGRGSESPALKFYAKNYFSEDQLYQIEKDPFEQENLYGNTEQKKRIKALKAALKEYVKIVPGTFPVY
jgi:arylsulfatase A-like enzyme